MNIKKLLAVIFAVALLALVGCGDNANTTIPTATQPVASARVHVAAISGPSGVALTPLMAQQDVNDTVNTYIFEVVSTPEEIVNKLSTGAADIAALPTNLAATLYQRTAGGVQMLGVTMRGVLSIVERGNSITNVADLRGKTIYTTGLGVNPEFILRHVLEQNGLKPGVDVQIEFLTDNAELSAKLAAGLIDVAMTPEPVTSTVLSKDADLRVALSLSDAWTALEGDSELLMSCLVVRTAFLADHAEAVELFMADCAASIAAVQDDVPAAAALCAQYGLIPNAAIAERAIPGCNLGWRVGSDMKNAIRGYYDVLFAADPKSLGGKLPGDDFYYGT